MPREERSSFQRGGENESGERRVGHGSGREGKRKGEGGGHENAGREWWGGCKDEDEVVKTRTQFLKMFQN